MNLYYVGVNDKSIDNEKIFKGAVTCLSSGGENRFGYKDIFPNKKMINYNNVKTLKELDNFYLTGIKKF